MKVQNLQAVGTSEWYTPPDIVEAAREWLGAIDLDPASCAAAQATVQAATWYDAERDGLAPVWAGCVFLNPPSPPRPWGEWLAAGVACGLVTRAVFVGYSIETLAQSQGWRGWRPGEPGAPSVVCVPARRPPYRTTAACRVAVLRKAGREVPAELAELDPSAIVELTSPAHASAIFGFGDPASFARAFSAIGRCYVGAPCD